MTRKDIIIISVLVNIGLLAILFITAMHTDEPEAAQDVQVSYNQNTPAPTPIPISQANEEFHPHNEPVQTLPVDEVDQSIREYFPETALPVEATEDDIQNTPEIMTQAESSEPVSGKLIEITVKQGDSLDKIARANGTTISAIKSANNLTSDKLKIGQKLKITLSYSPKTPIAAAAATPSTTGQDPEYYTVKAGDNPWKIAKQFHVKFEDLLKMNNLNEEKARNLKVGDKLRVK